MAEDIKSPQFPESIFEGTLSTWLKKEGDTFEQDDVLAEIETDKVVIEVTAQSDGQLEKIIIPEGSVIKSQETIGNYSKKITKKDNKDKTKPKVEEVKTAQTVTQEEVMESPKITSKKEVKGKIGPAAKKITTRKKFNN
jgi:2-oxoglutarate dehydrogenase E2 component (dihydrolipoamide succinyltransferase)